MVTQEWFNFEVNFQVLRFEVKVDLEMYGRKLDKKGFFKTIFKSLFLILIYDIFSTIALFFEPFKYQSYCKLEAYCY